jgi:hypothetical protein
MSIKHKLNWVAALVMIGAATSVSQAKTSETPEGAVPLPKPIQDLDVDGRVTADPRVRRYIMPRKVLWVSPAEQCKVENSENLLRPGSGQITLDNKTGTTLRHQGKAPAVLLDFGFEMHGGIQILVAGSTKNQPVQLRVRFGESATEAMSELGDEKNATNDHAVRDQTCLVPWLGSHEIGNTGFRFVRIDLLSTNAYVLIKNIRAVFLYRDLPYLGSFESNDPRLNRIWKVGAYTVHLNMQDYVWDGIKRDRLVWIGDMHPETMTINSVFGDVDVVRSSLDLIREDTPLPKWMNGISSYSMWWVLIHHSTYQYHGNLAYVEAQRDYLKQLLNQLINCIGPDNGEKLPEMRFLDWPTRGSGNKDAIHAGLHSLLVMTLQAGAELCGAIKETETKERCEEAAARMKQHIPNHGNSKQAAALMALAGLGDATTLNRQVLAVDGPKRMSTFYGYYVLQARAKACDYQGALDVIRDYWGGMLDYGATTFWEDFDLDWTQDAARIDELTPPGKKDLHGDFGAHCYKNFRHSLCHGWASGPTAWLSEHVLGVQVVEPGCKVIRLQPHLGDLEWVEGTFPTPKGVLKIRHEKRPDGTIKTKYDAPSGVKVIK